MILALEFCHLHGPYLERQSEQSDKALCIVVVVEFACSEGGQGLTVERVGGGGSGLDDIALVQLEFYLSGYILLRLFHKSLNGLTQRGEPLSFIDNLSEFVSHIFFDLHGSPIQHKFFELSMGLH